MCPHPRSPRWQSPHCTHARASVPAHCSPGTVEQCRPSHARPEVAEGRPRSPPPAGLHAGASLISSACPAKCNSGIHSKQVQTNIDVVKQVKQLPPLLSKSGRKLSSERSEQATEAPRPPWGRPRQVRLSTHLTANSHFGCWEVALAGGGGRVLCRTEAARTPGPGRGVPHARSVAVETGGGAGARLASWGAGSEAVAGTGRDGPRGWGRISRDLSEAGRLGLCGRSLEASARPSEPGRWLLCGRVRFLLLWKCRWCCLPEGLKWERVGEWKGRAGRRPASSLLAPRPPRASGEPGRVRVPRRCWAHWCARIRIPCCVAELTGRVCRT